MAGLYRRGAMFAVVAEDVAYLKVDDSNRDDFLRAGSAPFEPYPDKIKTTIRTFYEVPADVLENPDELAGLIVDRDARRLGIGRRLVEACAQWAQSNRFEQIRVRSNIVREEAHRFYSNVGFTKIKSQAVFAVTLPHP